MIEADGWETVYQSPPVIERCTEFHLPVQRGQRHRYKQNLVGSDWCCEILFWQDGGCSGAGSCYEPRRAEIHRL